MDNSSGQKRLVSFVLPHHGREPLLVETIESIFRQDIGNEQIEVIVVSKAAFDDTHSLPLKLVEAGVREFVRFIAIPADKTISFGRNHGAVQSTGEYLAFVDSDVRLAANWVSAMIRLLKGQPDNVLVSAVQVHDSDKNTVDIIKSSMSEANLGEVSALPGNALFISREVFNRSEKFPEYLETCEDWVFTNSLTKLGKLLLTNESSFVHLGEDKSFSALFFKEIWRGKSNLGSLAGRKIDLSEFPSIIVPVVVFLSPVVALLALFSGFKVMAIFAALFTLLAPLLYSIRLRVRSSVDMNFASLVYFYFVYFNARAIGMIKGLFQGNPANRHEISPS